MRNLIFFFFVLFISSCGKKVTISTSDSNPPLVKIHSIQNGNITTSSSDSTDRVEVDVLENSEIAFIAQAIDSLGVKSLTVEVIQNGSFEIKNQLRSTFTEMGSVSGNQGISQVNIGGLLKPDSYDIPMIIKANGDDFANNTAMTPPLVLNFVKPAVARLSASRSTINRNDHVTLTWETENANEVLLNGSLQNTNNGSKVVQPLVTTEYTLKAINELSVDRTSIVINVNQPPQAPEIISFNASPRVVNSGQSTTLSWDVRNATRVEINPGSYSSSQLSGSINKNPSQTTNYTLKAINNGINTEKSELVTVSAPMPTETCFTTPRSLAQFGYKFELNGLYYYDMQLSSTFSGPITKITNRSTKRIALITGGESIILGIGETTTAFNGYSVSRGWTVQCEFLITPKIEFCFEQ